MTNEEQVRAALLGAGQITTLLAGSRQSLSMFRELQESRWLAFQPTQSDLGSTNQWLSAFRSSPFFHEALHESEKVRAMMSQAYRVEGHARLIASGAAQWESLRRNVLSRLESLFVFRERVAVMSFLEKNFFLTPLLFQASERIKEFFGSATIVLEVSTDPENGNYQELWVRIQTSSTPGEALPTLTRFDEEWWLDASATSNELLNIKLEYV